VPLPVELLDKIFARHCPHCGYKMEKLGLWFQSVHRYRCEGCGQKLKMTYPEKVALFAAYGGGTENLAGSDLATCGRRTGNIDAG